ncbi:hypothetical protein FQN53_008539 [Emmonsiellopsis sp. PD_33]|nr:hypothetical protein FQN53_008539 [Emmonsiellopsis sp. PD_33]
MAVHAGKHPVSTPKNTGSWTGQRFVDILANNILQGIADSIGLSEIEDGEDTQPIAGKVNSDRTLPLPRTIPMNAGLPVLCAFGEAPIGDKHGGDIMPGVYRAPGVIFGMELDHNVDIWAIGNHGKGLSHKDGILNDEQHLVEVVSLAGLPYSS